MVSCLTLLWLLTSKILVPWEFLECCYWKEARLCFILSWADFLLVLVAFFVVVTFVCHIALPSHCRLQWSSERFCVTSWVLTMKCSVLYYWSSAGFFRVHLNHERPHPLFSVFLVISFLVLFVLLVLRVWVNSSYCQSRETLFKTLNKVCYKKSLRMFHFGVLTISRASSQLLFSFSCLVCLFPGFWWWN